MKSNIVLHENQLKIHNSTARFKVIKAGKRFGKSKWACFEIAQAALESEKKVFWYLAPTYGQAADIAWYELLNVIPHQFIRRKRESKLEFELISGSRIVLKGTENENQLRGPAITGGVIFDEAAYTDEYVWPQIIRGQLSEDAFAYFISSPNKVGRNWFTNFCAEAKRRQDMGNKDWAYFYYTIHDNPWKSPKEIEDIKSQTTDDKWNLEYMAIESLTSGIKFHEFSYEKNVASLKLEGCPVVRGLDWGISHPTVCLWARVDQSNKKVYIFDEYVKSGFTIKESCDVIKTKTGNLAVDWSVIDPSTKKRNSQSNRTDADEFARYGVSCIPGDNRDRGYDIVKMFLKTGRLVIDPKCTNLINELRTLQWADKDGDDCTDALRYMIVRVHDYMESMNVFENKEEEKRDPVICRCAEGKCEFHKREVSFSDFSDRRDNMNFIMSEIDNG